MNLSHRVFGLAEVGVEPAHERGSGFAVLA